MTPTELNQLPEPQQRNALLAIALGEIPFIHNENLCIGEQSWHSSLTGGKFNPEQDGALMWRMVKDLTQKYSVGIKMNQQTEPKQVIDWASVPMGTNIFFGVNQVSKGVFTGYSEFAESIFFNTFAKNIETGKITDCLIQSQAAIFNVRLDFTEPQPWQVYEEGVTVVPEWAECEYRGVNSFGDGNTNDVADSNKWVIDYIAHYRITDIKQGWTDDASEVTK